METLIWISQALLALAFLAAGGMKLSKSKADLQANPNMAWTEDFAEPRIKGIGALEVAGALGVVLPALLGVAEVLTPLAAVGLGLTMLGAMATHLRRGEAQALPVNVVLLALAVFVAVERFGPHAL